MFWRSCSDENGAIVVTGSPGRRAVRIDVKNVTTTSTTISWINRRTRTCTRRPLPHSPPAVNRRSAFPAVTPDAVDRVPGRESLEGLGTVRKRRAEDPVDVRLVGDGPQRVLRPQVPELLREFPVDVLVDLGARRRVGAHTGLVEVAVDDRVVEAAEVDRVV